MEFQFPVKKQPEYSDISVVPRVWSVLLVGDLHSATWPCGSSSSSVLLAAKPHFKKTKNACNIFHVAGV